MDQTRVKALELAIIFLSGRPVEDAQRILDIAELFCGYLDTPVAPVAADGDNYPRIQAAPWPPS